MSHWRKYATRSELRKFERKEARIHRLKVEIRKAQDEKMAIYDRAKYRRRKANDGS